MKDSYEIHNFDGSNWEEYIKLSGIEKASAGGRGCHQARRFWLVAVREAGSWVSSISHDAAAASMREGVQAMTAPAGIRAGQRGGTLVRTDGVRPDWNDDASESISLKTRMIRASILLNIAAK